MYGLTGSLGAGKSTVGKMLQRLGVAVCDADRLGHELLARPGPVRQQVAQAFPDCLDTQGVPQRRELARVVFSDPLSKRRLERILHPAIRRAVDQWWREEVGRATPAVVEAAVLLESAGSEWQDLAGIIVVVARPQQLLARARRRAGGNDDGAARRLQQQLPQSHKALAADFLIDNSGAEEGTWRQVQWLAASLHREWGGST